MVEEELAAEVVLSNELRMDDAVLLIAETFRLTDTLALADELEDDESSSLVAVDEYVYVVLVVNSFCA